MFVYNSGKLIENPIPISSTEFIYRLTHTTSGMNIEVYVNTEVENSDKPFKVYREQNGVYTVFQEFYRKDKTIKENFEEAILYFEDNIYKAMNETPPAVDSPRPDDAPQPETFNEVPIVGDIVQVGKNYGIVTDVKGTEVSVKNITYEEAIRMLKNQQNADIATSIEDVELAFGGDLKLADGAELRLPSTDPSTWNGSFKVGDKVKVRINFSDRADVNAVLNITSLDKGSAKPISLDEQGRNIGGLMRPENPSGILYNLSNGQSWEGKDLELVSNSVSNSKPSVSSANSSKSENKIGQTFSKFDTEKDNIIILRVTPKPQGGTPPPQGGTPPPLDQPVPKNIKNPLDETPPPPQGGTPPPDDGTPPQGGDQEPPKGGEDGGDQEPPKGGEDGGDQEPPKGGDQEPPKGGENGGDQEGTPKGEGGNQEGDDFGNNSTKPEKTLEELMRDIQNAFEKGQSGANDLQLTNDISILERALATPRDRIKETFKTIAVAKSAIGRTNIFGTDNEKRLNETLNQIFK